MRNESKRALTAVRDMLADVPKDWVALPENAAIADGLVAAPLEVMKRFGQWDEILKEPAPPEIFPIAHAMGHHIRAIAYAAKGETAKAREEQKAFREAAKKPAKDATFGNNKATELFAVGDDMLEGEILVREGKMEAGFKALRAAVAKEDKLRYSEPPDWVVPVRHALGAFLLKDGQATEAEAIDRFRSQPHAPAIEYLDQPLKEAELPGLYTACQCLVHPYRGEGFGLPIVVAMACGLPVIVTGSGAALDFQFVWNYSS
jgi:glycosyltransferase involved in cell wall biosynthesis